MGGASLPICAPASLDVEPAKRQHRANKQDHADRREGAELRNRHSPFELIVAHCAHGGATAAGQGPHEERDRSDIEREKCQSDGDADQRHPAGLQLEMRPDEADGEGHQWDGDGCRSRLTDLATMMLRAVHGPGGQQTEETVAVLLGD